MPVMNALSDVLSWDGIKITEWQGASLGAETRCILARRAACPNAGYEDTEIRPCVQQDVWIKKGRRYHNTQVNVST